MENDSSGVQRPRLGLPGGVLVVGFDASLNVSNISAADGDFAAGILGKPLATALAVRDAQGLQRAAGDALGGLQLTVRCVSQGGAGELVIRLGPDPGMPGCGLAVALESGDGPDGVGEFGRSRAEEFELISIVARELARNTHPDEVKMSVCEMALSVCGAERAVLFEPDESGQVLRATAAAGVEAGEAELSMNENSTPVMAVRTNTSRFTVDAAAESATIARFLENAGVASALWQPVARGRTVRGVLMLGWRRPLERIDDRSARLLEVVSIEAAVALDRGMAFGRLISMAATDPLTGLPNRRTWEDALRREMARAAREGTPLAVSMIDLDGFKAFNDSHGHPAGDRVLRLVADLWRPIIRATDSLGRLGGDEFAIVSPNCDPQRAVDLLDRLRDVPNAPMAFCSGVVVWDGNEDRSALIARADRALYEAKAAGPATTRFGG
ncbi:MAG: sensor domain-containing diguanylate cyclase [Solirubrobacterales bacterium]